MRSFKLYLTYRYGMVAHFSYNNLLNLSKRKANAQMALKYLRKCRSHGIIPMFLQNYYPNRFDLSFKDFFKNFHKNILNRLISQKYELIKTTSNQIDCLLNQFHWHLLPGDFEQVHHYALQAYLRHYYSSRASTRKKFQRQAEPTPPRSTRAVNTSDQINSFDQPINRPNPNLPFWPDRNFRDSLILNDAELPLTEGEKDLIACGAKFALPPKEAPVMETMP